MKITKEYCEETGQAMLIPKEGTCRLSEIFLLYEQARMDFPQLLNSAAVDVCRLGGYKMFLTQAIVFSVGKCEIPADYKRVTRWEFIEAERSRL